MFLRLIALLLFLSLNFLHAYDGALPKVLSIEVIPQNLSPGVSFQPALVLNQIQTKVGGPFSQNEFDEDLKKLAGEYDRVEPDVLYRDDGVSIVLKIWFKPKIRSIKLTGNAKLTSEKLIKELGLSAGDIFERDTFITGFNKIKAYYISKGYYEADLCFEIVEIPETGEIDIVIAAQEGKAGFIAKIEFNGFTDCEEEELRELMLTRKYFILLSWYTGRGCYHPEMIEHDRLTILSYLQDRGFADATVSMEIRETSARNRVVLVINADRGPCYSFGSITVNGSTIFSEEDIRDCLDIYEGYAYSPEGIRNTIAAIRQLYGSEGYIDAAIDAQLYLRPDAYCYDIVLTIEEGTPYYVGMIRVFGNCVTKSRVILNESLLCPGEVFDTRRLEGTETRLCNTGFFSQVNAYTVRTPRDEAGFRDVYIEVEEQDTGNLGVFFGFNSLQHIFGGIDITERNFNMAGILDIPRRGFRSLRGGGEYLHLKTNLGKRETSYLLQWTIPHFLDSPWILGFDLEKVNNREISRGYEIKTYGGDVHATYIINEFLKYDYYYRGRHTNVSVKDSTNPILLTEAAISGFVSAVGATAIYDSTDHPRKPTNGFRSRLLLELAGVGGNFDFMKFGYFNTYYYPLWKNGTLKFRADLQFIHTYNHTKPTSLPLSERLFLGGDTTVRGYRPFIIGPKFGNNEPRGGVSSYLLSEEYQHNLLEAPCLDAFLFMDAGFVSLSEFSVGKPQASVGFGIRLELLANMPMTIGMGFPIHPSEKIRKPDGRIERIDNSQRFFFMFGGTF